MYFTLARMSSVARRRRWYRRFSANARWYRRTRSSGRRRVAIASTSEIVRPGSGPRSGKPASSHASSANQSRPTYSMPSCAVRSDTLNRRPSTSTVPIDIGSGSWGSRRAREGVVMAETSCVVGRPGASTGRTLGRRLGRQGEERHQEPFDGGEERLRPLDEGHMPGPLEDDELGAQCVGGGPRRGQRDGILAPVDDERRDPEPGPSAGERREQVVGIEAL